jgi:hypothetical protein
MRKAAGSSGALDNASQCPMGVLLYEMLKAVSPLTFRKINSAPRERQRRHILALNGTSVQTRYAIMTLSGKQGGKVLRGQLWVPCMG